MSFILVESSFIKDMKGFDISVPLLLFSFSSELLFSFFFEMREGKTPEIVSLDVIDIMTQGYRHVNHRAHEKQMGAVLFLPITQGAVHDGSRKQAMVHGLVIDGDVQVTSRRFESSRESLLPYDPASPGERNGFLG